METTITNDYYLQFNETYFVSCGHSNKDVIKNSELPVSNTKVRLLGRRLYKGILKTTGEIMLVASLLAMCKYAGIYDVWLQLIDKLV